MWCAVLRSQSPRTVANRRTVIGQVLLSGSVATMDLDSSAMKSVAVERTVSGRGESTPTALKTPNINLRLEAFLLDLLFRFLWSSLYLWSVGDVNGNQCFILRLKIMSKMTTKVSKQLKKIRVLLTPNQNLIQTEVVVIWTTKPLRSRLLFKFIF